MTSVAFPDDERIGTLLREAERLAGSPIRLRLAADSRRLGRYEPSKRAVYLYRDMPEDAMLFAIGHELAHAIWWGRGYPHLGFVEWLARQLVGHSNSFYRFALLIGRINSLVQDIYADSVARSNGLLSEDAYDYICPPLRAINLNAPDWRFDGPRFQRGLEGLCQSVRDGTRAVVPPGLSLDLQLAVEGTRYATVLIRYACHPNLVDYEKRVKDALPGVHELGTQLAAIAQGYRVEEPETSRTTIVAIVNHMHIPESVVLIHGGGRAQA